MNLPNRLTVARLIMVPLFVVCILFDTAWGYITASVVFGIASFTDWLDGRIARTHNIVTNFGKLMDPMADKILVASAFVMMIEIDVLNVPGWTIAVILAREFLVTGARSMAAAEGAVIAANIWGKAKAMMQMIYIGLFLFLAGVCLLARDAWPDRYPDMVSGLQQVSFWTVVFVAVFTMASGIQFVRSHWNALKLGMSQ